MPNACCKTRIRLLGHLSQIIQGLFVNTGSLGFFMGLLKKVKDKTEATVKKVGKEGTELGKKGVKGAKTVAKKGATATKKAAKKSVKETKKTVKKAKK